MNGSKHTESANHAWSVAGLLRGDCKQSDYGKVILKALEAQIQGLLKEVTE